MALILTGVWWYIMAFQFYHGTPSIRNYTDFSKGEVIDKKLENGGMVNSLLYKMAGKAFGITLTICAGISIIMHFMDSRFFPRAHHLLQLEVANGSGLCRNDCKDEGVELRSTFT